MKKVIGSVSCRLGYFSDRSEKLNNESLFLCLKAGRCVFQPWLHYVCRSLVLYRMCFILTHQALDSKRRKHLPVIFHNGNYSDILYRRDRNNGDLVDRQADSDYQTLPLKLFKAICTCNSCTCSSKHEV